MKHICILCMPYEMCFGGWHAWISFSDLYVLVLPLLVKQIKILNRFRVTVSVHCPSGASVWSSNILSSSKKADKYVHLLGSQREAQLSLFFSLFFFFKETLSKALSSNLSQAFSHATQAARGPGARAAVALRTTQTSFTLGPKDIRQLSESVVQFWQPKWDKKRATGPAIKSLLCPR